MWHIVKLCSISCLSLMSNVHYSWPFFTCAKYFTKFLNLPTHEKAKNISHSPFSVLSSKLTTTSCFWCHTVSHLLCDPNPPRWTIWPSVHCNNEKWNKKYCFQRSVRVKWKKHTSKSCFFPYCDLNLSVSKNNTSKNCMSSLHSPVIIVV